VTGLTISARRQPNGFTLLELLVAIALLGLLTAILMAGFRFETRQVTREAKHLARSAKLPDAYAFLRAHLGDARPVVPVNSNGTAIVFDGRSGAVSFVDAAPQSALRAGLYLYSVYFGSGQLHIRWRPYEGLAPADTDESGDDIMLLDGVERAGLEYYGSLVANSGPAWNEEWRGVSDLPILIRLDLVFTGEDRAPALIVAPRLRLHQSDTPTAAPTAAAPQ